MKKTFLVCLIFIFNTQLQAQENGEEAAPSAEVPVGTTNANSNLQKPLTRPKLPVSGVPNESSSFIGDPDNIDPLNPNRENLKEDEEPVLEDIKQVLEAPPAPPPPPPIVIEKPKPIPAKPQRRPDDPDMKLEKKFNTIYKTYNINPTSVDVWAAATAKQTMREYIVQKGDTLWSISKILFGDPSFWPKIWALNKQGILNPHVIKPNSKIYFYMGDEVSTPTLSLGSPSAAPSVEQAVAADTDTGKVTADGKLPDSLPISRNKKYFEGDGKTDIKIDLGERPRFDYENISEVYITDKPIKTDVKIQISETAKFRCYEGRLLKDIKYIGKLVEDYEIFEPLNSFKTTIGTMYAYRAYGSARAYQRNKLKISDCKSIIATDLIIIHKEKMQTLINRQISITKKATLIGGPDIVAQTLFAPNQLAYVDFGSYGFEAGQEYKTVSQVTDEINGNFKIIEKYGSFAVVMITEVNDVIEIGDKVILN